MPAQIIQMIALAQIMDIWRPGRSIEDHLNHLTQIVSNFCKFLMTCYVLENRGLFWGSLE